MICVKSQTKEKWVNEGWHQPIALEERHVTASGAPGGCGPHGERHAPPPSHGYSQEQRLRWAIVPSHRRSLPVIKTQMWVVLPRFTVSSKLRVLVDEIARLPTLRTTHTHGLPARRCPPVCTPSAAFQFLTLPQLALSQPLSHSRAIFLCRWCLRALARCHERQVPMCQCRYAPPLNTFLPEGDSRHPHLTCVSACLEGTWSTTDHDFARCAPTASTRLGDSTADVVGRSS